MLLQALVVLVAFLSVSAEVPSRPALGYSRGYFPDCPGSNKTAIITKKSLKYLGFVVQGNGNTFNARRKRYNYYQMEDLAKDPDIDFKKKTLLYVIGYIETANYPIPWAMARGYKEVGYNVIILDVNRFTTVHYAVACRLMRPVGLHTAEALATLMKKGMNPKTLDIVGVSLGGQTISFIAKSFYKLTGIKVGRVTALDAAGPCFRYADAADRLDKTDADFVDSIHTNIDGFGMAYPMGHVSVYINGGEFQVDDQFFLPCLDICSHIKAFTLWHTALRHPKKFIMMKCDSVEQARNAECYDRNPMELNYFGLLTKKKKPGIYYLSTAHLFPYYLEMNGTKKEFDIWAQPAMFNEDDVMTV